MPRDERFVEIHERSGRRLRRWRDRLDRSRGRHHRGSHDGRRHAFGTFLKIFHRSTCSRTYQPSLVTTVYSDDRQPIGQFFIERRILTPLPEIPETLTQAVIATEDARFLNIRGWILLGCCGRPGRTFDMEGRRSKAPAPSHNRLARSLFLSSERSYRPEVRELILRLQRWRWSPAKEQILETYLNQIYFGQGAYGVGSAAHSYFDKDIRSLTLAESAFLGGSAEVAEPVFSFHGL